MSRKFVSTSIGFAACAALVAFRGVGAQEIRGRVFRSDSVTPAGAVVVTAVDARGLTAARAVSRMNGDYVLQVRPGRFEVRALRIGFQPTVVRDVLVEDGQTRTLNIALTSLPVTLSQVDVRGSGDCALKGKDAATYLRLWEQARGALAATSHWDQSGDLDVQVIRVSGREDREVDYTPLRYPEVDTLRVRQDIVDRVMAATPAESLLKYGYVRRQPGGTHVFDFPGPEALLSDGFVDSHCFSIEKSNEHADWIGLGFRPRRTVKGITDIRGTLWMERESAELRRLQFDYVNVSLDEYDVCDFSPFIAITPEMLREVPPLQQRTTPQCSRIGGNAVRTLNLGGQADFTRLDGGEWLVSRWKVRTPPDTARWSKLPWKVKIENRKPVRCHVGPDCHTVTNVQERLVTLEGMVTRVMRDGKELYRDTAGSSLVDAMAVRRAGISRSSLRGGVTDTDGRPLLNAIVQAESPWLATFTDSTGAFAFHTLPAGDIAVSVRRRGYQSVRFSVTLVRDSTHRASVTLAR